MSEGAQKPKWGARKRLEYIDFRLFWDGRFTRDELAKAFEMSLPQASADVAAYQEQAGGNLVYDPVQKSYVRGPNFRPSVAGDNADRYLLQLVAMARRWMDRSETWFQASLPPVEVVALDRPPTNPVHLLAILDAIRLRQEIEVDYRSLTGTPPSWRGVAPHALAHNSGHWYVRVWARDHNDFRDYSLNRIRDVRAPRPSAIDPALDYEWHHKVDLEIVANPALPIEKRRAVEEDYGMTDGRLLLPVRLSLSFYLIIERNLDVAPGTFAPERQQLVLENRQEIEAARLMARRMSTQALQAAGEASQ